MDLNAIPTRVRAAAEALHLDSRETILFARQLEHIQREVYQTLYPELRGRYLVPMGPDQAPPGTKTIVYQMWDAFGMAKVISHWAQDLPRVGVSGKEFRAAVKVLGESYGWTQNDIKAAALTGQSLPQMNALAAREVMERTIDNVIFYGLPEAGTTGLLNNPNITIVSAPTGTWSGATAQQKLDDLTYLAQATYTASKGTVVADTIVMAPSLWTKITGVTGADLNTTVLKAFLANNPFITTIEQSFKMETAGADGGPRLMAYKRDPRVFDLQIPDDYSELPPEVRGLSVSVAASSEISGVICRYPLGAVYCDNLG